VKIKRLDYINPCQFNALAETHFLAFVLVRHDCRGRTILEEIRMSRKEITIDASCEGNTVTVDRGDKVYFHNASTFHITVSGLKSGPKETPTGGTGPNLPGIQGQDSVPIPPGEDSADLPVPPAGFVPPPDGDNEYGYIFSVTGCPDPPLTGNSPKMEVGG
jgi:hypothetical protein